MKTKIIAAAAAIACLCSCAAPQQTAEQTAEPSCTASPSPTPLCTQPPQKYDNMSTKGTGWGLVRKKGAAPEVDLKGKKLLEEHNGYYIDESMPKALYLTFDEGYENGFTSKILDVLQSEQVPAAFFVTGPYLNHPNLPQQTAETVQKELGSLNSECEKMYGASMHYMRPPEGEYSEKVLAVAEDMGYKTIMWSFAYKDWVVDEQPDVASSLANALNKVHGGAIYLLHAESTTNASMLADFIDGCRAKGFEFGYYSKVD